MVFFQRMEHGQSVIIRFLCQKRVSPEDIQARLKAQFGNTTYSECSERRVRLWCHYVRQEREDMHDEV
jgi:hypothetical protein